MNLSWETISALVLIGSTMGTTIFWTALMLGRFQAQIQESARRHAESERRLEAHSEHLEHHDGDIRQLQRHLYGRREGDAV